MTPTQIALASRSSKIQWPKEYSPEEAGFFSHNEGLIKATPERVWQKIIEAPKWPIWYGPTESFQIEGDAKVLSLGAKFRWVAQGFEIDGNVVHFSAPNLLQFTGAVPGQPPSILHAFLVSPHVVGTLVTYEEVGMGERAKIMGQKDDGNLHRIHNLWLAGLKWVCESSDRSSDFASNRGT